jgi:hypothetical protein
MEITMNYDCAYNIVLSKGWNEFLEILKKRYVKYELYCCSTAWFTNDKYVCKVRGTYGDLIIKWEHKKYTIK